MMKTTKQITFLLLTLILSVNAYAQKAKPAKGMDEVLLATDAQESKATQTAQANATQEIKALYENDKITDVSIEANYSNANSNITIKAKNTADGMVQNITVKPAELTKLKLSETLKGVANATDRATAFNDKVIASKIALLALSQAVCDKEVDECISIDLCQKQDGEGSKVSVKMATGDKTVAAELNITKTKNGAYKITGKAGDASLELKLVAKDDTFTISGDVKGNDVKTTISSLIDLSLRLDSSMVTELNGNGTPLRTREAINTEEGIHLVIDTPASGNSVKATYKGTTLIPFEEYKVLSADEFNVIVE